MIFLEQVRPHFRLHFPVELPSTKHHNFVMLTYLHVLC